MSANKEAITDLFAFESLPADIGEKGMTLDLVHIGYAASKALLGYLY